MNIACIACPARYAVPDERIVGRKVRVGCKRCGTKLVVDGTSDPPAVRADTGVPSTPPPVRYHLAISHDQRERGDLARIVELYGQGAVTPSTLAWREGMSQWQSLFEIEPIAQALRAAGYSPRQAGGPSYDDEESETRVAGGDYAADDDERTHIARSPLEDEGARELHRFDEDDNEATSVFDSEALHGGGWSEPASFREPPRHLLAAGEWHEHGRSSVPPDPTSKPPGAWTERGLEDDEVTRMVASLDEQPKATRERAAPAVEFRRKLPSVRPSARPPSLPPEEARPTGHRREDSLLFSLEHLTKQEARATPATPRAELDFSDVAPLSLGPPVNPESLGSSVAVLAPPTVAAQQPEALASVERDTDEIASRRGSGWRVLAAVVLLLGAALGALYATGRWPLVTGTAASLWQRVQGAR